MSSTVQREQISHIFFGESFAVKLSGRFVEPDQRVCDLTPIGQCAGCGRPVHVFACQGDSEIGLKPYTSVRCVSEGCKQRIILPGYLCTIKRLAEAAHECYVFG